jgi:hypothetical protein
MFIDNLSQSLSSILVAKKPQNPVGAEEIKDSADQEIKADDHPMQA